jgi:hypothetical protein
MPDGVTNGLGCLDTKEWKVMWDVTISAADFPAIGDSVICNNIDTGFDKSDDFFSQPDLLNLNGGTLDDILSQWGVAGFTGHNYDPSTGDNDLLTANVDDNDWLSGATVTDRAILRYVENSEGKIRFQFKNVGIADSGDFQFKFVVSSFSFSNDCATVYDVMKFPVDETNQYSIYYNDPDVDWDEIANSYSGVYLHFVQEVLYFYSGTTASGGAFDETATGKHLAALVVTENEDFEGFYNTFKTEVKCGTTTLTQAPYTVDICPECPPFGGQCQVGYNVLPRGHLTWGYTVPETSCTDNVISTLIRYDELSFENQHQQKYSLHVHSNYPATSQVNDVNAHDIVDLVVRFEKNSQYTGAVTDIPLSCREIFIEYAYQGSTINKQLRDSDLTFTDINGNTIFDGDCSTSVEPLGSSDPTIITHTYPIHIGILNDIANVYKQSWAFYAYDLNVKVYGTIPKFESNRKIPCDETNKLLSLW